MTYPTNPTRPTIHVAKAKGPKDFTSGGEGGEEEGAQINPYLAPNKALFGAYWGSPPPPFPQPP